MAIGQKLKTTQPIGAVTVAAPGATHHKRGGVDVNEDGIHYGVNGWSGASSDTTPGTTSSDMAKSFPVVSAHAPNIQTRTVSDKPYPAANKGASAGPKVPDKIGNNQADPVRQP